MPQQRFMKLRDCGSIRRRRASPRYTFGSKRSSEPTMNTRGFDSTWLPEQQEHAVGKKAHFDLLRGDLHRGAMWTDDASKAGDLLSTKWQELPSGIYTAVLQVWDRADSGKPAGTFLAESPDGVIAHNPV